MYLYGHQCSKMEESSDPKSNALGRVLDIVPNGKCTAPMQPVNVVADDVPKTLAEAKVEGYVSVGAKIVRSTEDLTKHLSCKDFPEAMNLCDPGPMELQAESSIGISSISKQITLSHTHEFGSEMVNNEVMQANHVISAENIYHIPVEDQKSEFAHINTELKNTIPEEVIQISCLESLTSSINDQSRYFNSDQSGVPPENAATDCRPIQLVIQSDDATKISGLEELVIGQKTVAKSPNQLVDTGKRGRGRPRKVQTGLEQLVSGQITAAKSSIQLGDTCKRSRGRPRKVQTGIEQLVPGQKTVAKSSNQLVDTGKRSRGRPRKVQSSPTSLGGSVKVLPEKRKDTQELSVTSSRSLRLRSQEKSVEPDLSNIVAEEGADGGKTRKKRKKRMEENKVDEFSRIRTHLRYLLHRIKYEKNFIDAYSGEGWKGQSLDKIKPEKELQRAKAEILGRKLKIRDLFQRLDLSRSEGRLPEILFDSRGEIDSEDIFCAKCGSKDVTLSNDIILCDGACERGFHQFCLDPPLLKEYIPPDDEGWLCPGCECKLDCIKLLNDSQETNILLGDSWEKVFAEEAAAAASGRNVDDNSGLPSDDSEDDDYDPGGPDLNEKAQEDESSSDESDYHPASEDMQVLPQKEPCLGLPPDDSEDDDYDPNHLVIDQMFKDSSCSDFTSDSEDLTAVFDDCKHSGQVQGPQTSTPDHVGNNEEGCGHPGQGDAAPLYPRRQVESLDYKKLHDEECEKTSSDSSDEDYTVTSSSDKINYNSDKEATRLCEGSAAPVTSGESISKTLYGKHATQILLQSFKENQYPQQAVKESLAADLALSVRQVSKWFDSTRWSFHHSSHLATGAAEFALNEVAPHQKSIKSGSSSKLVPNSAICSKVEKKGLDEGSPSVTDGRNRDVTLNMVADEGNVHIPCITETRKGITKVGTEATEPTISSEMPKLNMEDVTKPRKCEKVAEFS